jgi:hypothetical protein
MQDAFCNVTARLRNSLLVRANFLRAGRRDIDFTLSGFSRNFEEMQRAMQVARR